ncbi:NAD(P)-dependent dehydrogenase, short-chain alcohol dehydrogenase family [Pustulibacterium marinum]|uniref:NAD(P)-dependent dehydrogenase, short-chain alcohol dehydrogenase family n=1 Tax=Pustulibacterium marinum TaxID=1224947 RepID=A0A1I7G106_9FLAO|nr:SDR family oxidoreductase [Pustulibacterium marinum]SFU42129.1 NAD(P)-dependent dehydrogenase, short-chain alcohol dehydrogenase family [Pustulibacterium marinum]
MKTAFITGANKGIGFEVAKQLAEKGVYVFLGSRDLEKGQQAVDKLKQEGITQIEVVQIDVTDNASITQAQQTISNKCKALDILINNAGISGGQPQTSLSATMQQFHDAYETNVFGVVRVTQAFISLMQKSSEPRIVNVSSSQGSITLHSNSSYNYQYYDYKGAVYLSSKAALNMYTVNLAYDLKDTPFKVNAVSPGFTKTDFNGNRGTGTVKSAGNRILKYVFIDANGPSGKFFCEETNPESGEIPW